jgi:hypothetical protein
LALLMGLEWLDPREPLATWGSLLTRSVQLAALEAAPVGYLLWLLRQPRAAREPARDGVDLELPPA